MPSINLRQLRDTRKLKQLLDAGEAIELRERNRVIARITPEKPEPKPKEWPDFATRLRDDFGDRVIPAVQTLLQERENSRY
jgi:antitoxin (DNA-binding transcriptional repressor) of toxin-antitoxin stability system